MNLKLSKNLIDAMEKNNLNNNSSSKIILSSNLEESKEKVGSSIQIEDIFDSSELIEKLYQRNTFLHNEDRDKKNIEKWLNQRKNGKVSIYETFDTVNYSLEKINEAGLLFEGGMQISGTPKNFKDNELKTRGKYDYRITLTNSDKITTEELIAFLQTFIDESKKRNLNLRTKSFLGKDLFILYCHEEELYNTVKLLEELKDSSKYGQLVSDATKKFGDIKEFSATLNNEAYYGISMASSETGMDRYLQIMNSNQVTLKGSYGGAFGNTFGDYIDKLLEESYQSLFNINPEMVTVSNMYNEMKKKHKKFMLGDSESLIDIPFWMNLRNYGRILKLEEYKKNENIYNNDIESVNEKGRGR